MGTAESSHSSELGTIAGLTNQSSFHRQSPNVARLIRSETSSKMEYEFPISDVPTSGLSHHHHSGGPSNHSIIPGNNTRHDHISHHQTSSSSSQQQITLSSHLLGHNDNIISSKIHSNQTSNVWLRLTSCFACRTRRSNNSSMNSLRDKVHAIRIVRASNDLTPAVFDSHYNIITLEQLRECDNNGSGNMNSLPNDLSDVLPSQNPNPGASVQNGNGSVTVTSSSSSSKKDNSHRMRKKKKKQQRAAQATRASKITGSDDDDDDGEGSKRTYQ
jgi:hypothetical protein